MPKHGSINLYVHGNQKARYDGQPRTSTSTLTQLLNYETRVFGVHHFIKDCFQRVQGFHPRPSQRKGNDAGFTDVGDSPRLMF